MPGRSLRVPLLAAVFAAALVGALILRPPHAMPLPLAGAKPEAPWPMYQRVPSHNAVFEEPGPAAKWIAELGGKINGGLAITGGTVYAGSFDKKLYAIDERTGAIRWTAQTDNILMSTPVIEDGLVVVGSGNDGWLRPDDYNSQVWGRPQGDDIYAFSTADGHLVWKMHTVGQNMPTAAIDNGRLVFANGDAHAYALDLHSGSAQWTIGLAGIPTMASMNAQNGVAFTSTCHNAPYFCETRAIAIRDGRTLWTNPNGGSDCAPTIDDGLVFVNGERDDNTHFHTGGVLHVAAINERTGKTVWAWNGPPGPFTYITSKERQIAGVAHDGVLFQPIGNASEVVALNEHTGKLLWSVHTSANVKMSPVVKGNTVYFGDTAGIFYRVNRVTGHVIHASSYLQPFSTSPPVIAGNTLYVADGSLILAMPLSDV